MTGPISSGQLRADIGRLSDLTTTAKNSLVEALNEVNGGGGVIDVTNYGVMPSAAGAQDDEINDAIDAVTAHATEVGGRATLYFPPGVYRFASPLAIPGNVNVWMDSSYGQYSGTDWSEPPVTLGTSGESNLWGVYRISFTGTPTVRFDDTDAETPLVRVLNPYHCEITLQGATYAPIGIQFYAENGLNATYSRIMGGFTNGTKIGLDCRTVGTGWVNENNFVGINFTHQGCQHLGSIAGARFSTADGGEALQNANRFWGCCFQMQESTGAQAPLNFSTLPLTAVANNWYVNQAQTKPRQYLCVTGGNCTTAPTHTDGGTTNPGGVATFKDMGPFYRIPVFEDQCATNVQFRDCRFETAVGGFVLRRNPAPATYLTSIYDVTDFWDSVQSEPTRPEIDLTLLNPDAGWKSPLRGHVTCTHAPTPPQPVVIDDIHKRALISQTGASTYTTTVRGFAWMNLSTKAFTVQATTNGRLLRDGLFFNSTAPACFLIDTELRKLGENRRFRRFTVTASGNTGTLLGADVTWAAPLDANNEFVSLLSTPFYYSSTNGVITDSAVEYYHADYNDNGIFARTGRVLGFGYGASTDVKRFAVGIAPQVVCKSIYIQPWSDGSADKLKVFTPFEPDSMSGSRFAYCPSTSYGILWGIFDQPGEIIYNAAGSGYRYWIVKTPGMLAIPWANETMITGELREGTTSTGVGRIYAATGTSAGTTPTHTTLGDIVDGWEYVAPKAVLVNSSTSTAEL